MINQSINHRIKYIHAYINERINNIRRDIGWGWMDEKNKKDYNDMTFYCMTETYNRFQYFNTDTYLFIHISNYWYFFLSFLPSIIGNPHTYRYRYRNQYQYVSISIGNQINRHIKIELSKDGNAPDSDRIRLTCMGKGVLAHPHPPMPPSKHSPCPYSPHPPLSADQIKPNQTTFQISLIEPRHFSQFYSIPSYLTKKITSSILYRLPTLSSCS